MKKFLLSILSLVACFVVATAQTESSVTFDFATTDYGLERVTTNDGAYLDDGTEVNYSPITLTLNKADGTNGWRLWSDGLRAYKNSDAKLTVAIAKGCTITQINFTTAGTFTLVDGQPGSYSSKTWTGSAESVQFVSTATTNKSTSKLVIYYTGTPEGQEGPNAPSIKMAAENFVEISAEEGATVYYTLDGTEPTATEGTPYTGAIKINTACTVKAIAEKDGATSVVTSFEAYSTM